MKILFRIEREDLVVLENSEQLQFAMQIDQIAPNPQSVTRKIYLPPTHRFLAGPRQAPPFNELEVTDFNLNIKSPRKRKEFLFFKKSQNEIYLTRYVLCYLITVVLRIDGKI